jgi:hypothetical protein
VRRQSEAATALWIWLLLSTSKSGVALRLPLHCYVNVKRQVAVRGAVSWFLFSALLYLKLFSPKRD